MNSCFLACFFLLLSYFSFSFHSSHIFPLCIHNSIRLMWNLHVTHQFIFSSSDVEILDNNAFNFVNTSRKYFIILDAEKIPFETERLKAFQFFPHIFLGTIIWHMHQMKMELVKKEISPKKCRIWKLKHLRQQHRQHSKRRRKKTKVTVGFDWISTRNKSIRQCNFPVSILFSFNFQVNWCLTFKFSVIAFSLSSFAFFLSAITFSPIEL